MFVVRYDIYLRVYSLVLLILFTLCIIFCSQVSGIIIRYTYEVKLLAEYGSSNTGYVCIFDDVASMYGVLRSQIWFVFAIITTIKHKKRISAKYI